MFVCAGIYVGVFFFFFLGKGFITLGIHTESKIDQSIYQSIYTVYTHISFQGGGNAKVYVLFTFVD
ncbi:hypothetical protein BY458DRAFT_307492 [Sporodiniella umbellata]|nr:hypothetical protein BY458DRAFT_307492 [Sporodiniella umbellata]